jgi:plastocyanin
LTVQFNVAGTYRYRCRQHSSSFTSGMIFSVTVLPKGTHLVTLTNTKFTPSTLAIPVGDTVIFKNASGTHSATCEQEPTCGSHALQASPWSLTNKFSVAGTYHYRCLQHSTDFTSGMVMTLTVEGPPSGPIKLDSPRIQDGEFRFGVGGPAGGTFVVEGSEDFKNWTPLTTNTPPDGIFGFSEPVSLLRRYYRVRR